MGYFSPNYFTPQYYGPNYWRGQSEPPPPTPPITVVHVGGWIPPAKRLDFTYLLDLMERERIRKRRREEEELLLME